MTCVARKRRQGFSLIELVIVVVIIGIIGAIAIPRISRGAAGAADSATIADLAVMRNAIDLYATEHGGTFPTLAAITNQLTQYTDSAGAAQAASDTTHIYGPYVRKVPALKVGPATAKGFSAFTDTSGTASCGWVYTAATGTVVTNTGAGDVDASGTLYNTY